MHIEIYIIRLLFCWMLLSNVWNHKFPIDWIKFWIIFYKIDMHPRSSFTLLRRAPRVPPCTYAIRDFCVLGMPHLLKLWQCFGQIIMSISAFKIEMCSKLRANTNNDYPVMPAKPQKFEDKECESYKGSRHAPLPPILVWNFNMN